MTTRVRPTIAAAALFVLLALFWALDAWHVSGFRAACKRVRPSDSREDVASALERAGGRARGVSEREQVWVQESAIFERRGVCTVHFDESKHAAATRYEKEKGLGSRY